MVIYTGQFICGYIFIREQNYLRTRCIASLRLRCRSSLSRGLRPGFDGGLGAEVGLVGGWIPNRMYPSLSITTLFHNNEFKNTSYNLPQNLLEKYDCGAMTLHELVNELFEPWEQVDESQHSLLAAAFQTAAGGISAPHVGTGAGGLSSDLPWNGDDKDKFRRPKLKNHGH